MKVSHKCYLCKRPAIARGLCRKHYGEWWIQRNKPLEDMPTRQCIEYILRYCTIGTQARIRLAKTLHDMIACPEEPRRRRRHALAIFRDYAGGLTVDDLATGLGVRADYLRRIERHEIPEVRENVVLRFACACMLPYRSARRLLEDSNGNITYRWAAIMHAVEHYEPLPLQSTITIRDLDSQRLSRLLDEARARLERAWNPQREARQGVPLTEERGLKPVRKPPPTPPAKPPKDKG